MLFNLYVLPYVVCINTGKKLPYITMLIARSTQITSNRCQLKTFCGYNGIGTETGIKLT